MNKIIKINFADFWPDFDKKNNFFFNTLAEKFQVQISENPDYLFYSVFGVEHKKYNCIKIFYTGECIVPNFSRCDYAMGFDYIDFGDRYCRFPNYMYKEKCLELAAQKHLVDDTALKRKFCSFCYSNPSAKERQHLFKRLSRYKRVDSGGAVLNNIGYTIGQKGNKSGRDQNPNERDFSKIDWQSKYKFCIAYENVAHPGYTTEKILQAFASQTIPLYWGNPLIEREFNKNAFINCNNLSYEEIVQKVMELDKDDEAYMKMLREPAFSEAYMREQIRKCKAFLWHIVEKDKKEMKRVRNNYMALDDDLVMAKQILIQEAELGKFDIEFIKKYLKGMLKGNGNKKGNHFNK